MSNVKMVGFTIHINDDQYLAYYDEGKTIHFHQLTRDSVGNKTGASKTLKVGAEVARMLIAAAGTTSVRPIWKVEDDR